MSPVGCLHLAKESYQVTLASWGSHFVENATNLRIVSHPVANVKLTNYKQLNDSIKYSVEITCERSKIARL